jgi:hypothetical protein
MRGNGEMADNGIWGGLLAGGSLTGGIALVKWLLGRFKQDGLDEERDKRTAEALSGLRSDMTRIVDKLEEVGSNAKELQVSQNVVNAITAKGMESLVAKMDQHSEKLADMGATVKLLTDNNMMMRQQIDLMRGQIDRKVDKS